MKKIKYLSIAVAALAATVSCTKGFVERNTNPEEATDEMLTWDNLLAGSAFAQMTRNVIPTFQLIGTEEYGSANYQVVQDLTGNLFAGYIGVVNTGFNANNVYDITARAWYEAMFNDAYVRATGSWESLDMHRDESPEAAAMGDILKVAVMHRVTDTYGPIPYLQIGKGLVTMQYDSQETVYRKFFEELDSAISTLTSFWQAQPDTKLLADYDNVYNGDLSKWLKFANTLRMRLAMRVVYADNALAMEQAEAALNSPAGLMTTSADLAAFRKPSSGAWENPLYVIQYSFNDDRIGATIEAYMNGFNDPRMPKYFVAGSDGQYHGVRNGISLTADYQNSSLLSTFNCTNNDDMMWMNPAEAWFLKAEYWLRKGDKNQARQCYEEGIRVSFDVWGTSGADDYIADSEHTPGSFVDVVNGGNSYNNALSNITVAWNASGNFENNLEQIITQKYIAVFPEGQEAWSEFRRTGYPKVIPYSNNRSGGQIDTQRQIRRLNYPSSEYRTNADNVRAAANTLNSESSLGTGDNGGTRVWWDKNTRF
ncbi:MAG: SusD/RagB family nutrient-binding outer membrane lipoprotein [Bacteroidales bacterium]|nr:SusD/RagB family nutrient-binding outer membrane lipoprotein [Bacteroides sp.]MCM1197375.1 SusD/RagB family nutrient-binding outer membrane lipoprotein [Clostridium sp.]MCM1501609.1 SusD/RagB family nutrient-binding outer membrane lipoprotein [Bacteroidales bacterium]